MLYSSRSRPKLLEKENTIHISHLFGSKPPNPLGPSHACTTGAFI